MKKLNQTGSAIVIGLLALLLVVAVGGVGFYVFKTQSDKKDTKTAQSSPDTGSSSQSGDTTKPTNSGYLEIKEMGIKVLVADASVIPDLYYQIKTEDGITYASVSAHSLNKLDSECSPNKGSLFSVVYYTNPNAPSPLDGSTTMKEAFPGALELNGKYYYVAHSSSSCSSKEEAQKREGVIGPLLGALRLEKL